MGKMLRVEARRLVELSITKVKKLMSLSIKQLWIMMWMMVGVFDECIVIIRQEHCLECVSFNILALHFSLLLTNQTIIWETWILGDVGGYGILRMAKLSFDIVALWR